jgi:cell division transport system ATP-binding protein
MSSEPIISLREVDIFQQEQLILGNVNLTVDAGEFVYLIGKVGSGKSSLIKILHAELEFSSGEVKVAGYDLRKIKQSEVPFLRRKVGVVFQDFRLLTDRNVHDNLSFVLKATGWKQTNAIESRIQQVIDRVGMEHKLKSMPHKLSGGEQQRIVIARAILNDPEIILADEPTGNLDPETSDELMRIFKEINGQGKTIIMATHDYQILNSYPSRILVCASHIVSDSSKGGKEVDFSELLEE